MTPPQKDGDGDVDMDVSLKRRGLELECDNRINDPLLIVRGGAANRAVDDSTASKMNKIRDAIFPVYGIDEMKKFFLLGALKFFIIIVLTITRDTKDTLVVTQCGAEAISFLKIYGVLPAAVLVTALYGKASSVLPRELLFNVTCIPFFLFFLAYDFILRPNLGVLERTITFEGNNEVIGKILSHWTSALFFVVAEIYSSVSIGILFWKTANDFVSPKEAQRFYPLFAYTSGFAPILAGQYISKFASQASSLDDSMRRLTFAIGASAILILGLNRAICATYNVVEKSNDSKKVKKQKPKMKMSESIAFLASSKYLRCLATMVVSYGLMYNLTEVSWKSLLKKKHPDALSYQRFMGNFSSIVGASTFIVIFAGTNVLKHLGWRMSALATPIVMVLFSLPFFTNLLLFNLDKSEKLLDWGVSIGTILILLSRSFKYGMFDATTQMAYIPLDDESKVKGKAAIDVLGSRLGKSGASFLQQGLILMFGNVLNAAPVVCTIYYAIAFFWLNSVQTLGGFYTEMTSDNQARNIQGKKSR